MGGDQLDEILGYLGLGPPPVAAATAEPDASPPEDLGGSGDRHLASSHSGTLWLSGHETAEWIEVRGAFATLRATRPKAKLLAGLRIELERWADGGSPQAKSRDLEIRTRNWRGERVLEVAYRTWRPLRITRDQARCLLGMFDHVMTFADG